MVDDKVVADLVGVFYKYATDSMGEDAGGTGRPGIFPLPMVAVDKDGKMEVSALAVNPPEAKEVFLKKIVKREVEVAMLGLDRTTRPGQGTEFADVLTCMLWVKREDWTEIGAWRDWFKFAVINYQWEPRIVRPFDWENEFWTRTMKDEVAGIILRRRGQPL